MPRVLPAVACSLLLAGCVAVPYYPGGYAPQPGYGAAPPVAAPPPATYYAPAPVFEQGYGYVIIDPLPRLCCGFGWYQWHYRGGDGRWHRSWRHR
jgi:hypothetical protein